jgi:hypothetical protein
MAAVYPSPPGENLALVIWSRWWWRFRHHVLLGGTTEEELAPTYLSLACFLLLSWVRLGLVASCCCCVRRVSSYGVSAPSALSLMVSEYQMSGGVPPLPPFPSNPCGRHWMVVRGPGCAGGCHHHFHGRSSCLMILDLRVHRHGARISNAGWCGLGCAERCHKMVEGMMVMVKPASMLFGEGASRRSVGVFRLVSRLFLESVYHGSSLFPFCVFGCSVSLGSAICA